MASFEVAPSAMTSTRPFTVFPCVSKRDVASHTSTCKIGDEIPRHAWLTCSVLVQRKTLVEGGLTAVDFTVHRPESLLKVGFSLPTSKPSFSSAPTSRAFQAILLSRLVRLTAQAAAPPKRSFD